jgi:uncharacterized protein YkwD
MKVYASLLLTLAAAAVVGLSAPAGQGAKDGEKIVIGNEERTLVELTNAERKKENLPALKFSPMLWKIARAHSANMAKQGKAEHKLDGKTPFQRLKEAGYRYAVAGENVAKGSDDLPAVMAAWMASPGHRKNILEPKYREIAIGIALDPEGVPYFTQLFGTQKQGR